MIAFIPSTKRQNKQTSFNAINKSLETFIVVPENEYDMYNAHFPGHVLSCPKTGIAPTRDWIVEYAIDQGIDKFVMFDDDITPQRRRADGTISNSSQQETDMAINWLELALDEYPHASWSVRSLDFATPGKEKSPGRMMHVLAYKTDVLYGGGFRFLNGVAPTHVQDDFNMTLQLLTHGFPNIISLEWRSNPSASNSKGGASTWRTLEIHNESAKRMAELYPQFVRLREKKNWQGMVGTQYDITVQWRKAWEYGKDRFCSP